MLDVYKIKDDVPLILFSYKEVNTASKESFENIYRKLKTASDDMETIDISDLEQLALVKLFKRNGKNLHPRYQEANGTGEAKKLGLQASFVLPLCPLSMHDLGRLTRNPGCEICGKKDTSRCTGCFSTTYCSRGEFLSYLSVCEITDISSL